jgi:hypothetical protein
MAITARTVPHTEDDVSYAVFRKDYGAATMSANDKAIVDRAISDGSAMVFSGVKYATTEPSSDVIIPKYRHLWKLAAIFHAKLTTGDTQGAASIYTAYLSELNMVRAVYLRGAPGRAAQT